MTDQSATLNTAQRIVARSCRTSAVCNWRQFAVSVAGGTIATAAVVAFADGSAVTFDTRGLPVEYVGAVRFRRAR